MTALPQEFAALLEASVGPAKASVTLKALETEPSVSLRLNPSKLRECPFGGASPVPWSPYGFFLQSRPSFTLDPLFHAGCYYVQDSSAMYVGHVFRQIPLEEGASVLDLCAAPGGKTTDLAASLRERFGSGFSLLSNEVMRSRYAVLRSNVESWGDSRVGTVSRDPSAFGGEGVFDVVVADVPCSGEGMFRKDERARAEWSMDTVEFCASRSRRIIADIWPALKTGGYLLFSTCTFNHMENDSTVAWVACTLGADIIPLSPFEPVENTEHGQILLPGLVKGEGQYVALLRKHGTADCIRRGDPLDIFKAWRPGNALPADIPQVDVDRGTALRYLHGDAVVLPEGSPTGPVTISYMGHPLGSGKNLGKRCNNLYPKAKRIRMDI